MVARETVDGARLWRANSKDGLRWRALRSLAPHARIGLTAKGIAASKESLRVDRFQL